MKTIVLASHNPVKIAATQSAFMRMFPGKRFQVRPVTASSGVSAQPMSEEETLRGALNRARAAAEVVPEADFWAGIEGGVAEHDGSLAAFAWVVVSNGDLIGKSRTGTFFLPPAVARLVRQGVELGEADDRIFGASNSKQKNGAVGLLTGNVIIRKTLYEQAVILALTTFKNPNLYAKQE